MRDFCFKVAGIFAGANMLILFFALLTRFLFNAESYGIGVTVFFIYLACTLFFIVIGILKGDD